MAEDNIEKADAEKVRPPTPSRCFRIGVGLLAGFLLHQTLVTVGAMAAPIVVSALGDPERAQYFHSSPSSIVWLLAWASGVACIGWWKKPSVREWTLPFVPLTCLWFLSCCARADTPEEAAGQEIGKGMLLVCAMIMMLGITDLILGEKWWRRESFERLMASIVPGFAYRHAPPDILERLSSSPEPSPELLWQSTPYMTEAASQPLLPNGLPRRPSETVSDQPETLHDIPVRHAQDTREVAPEQLLRASQSEDQ